MAEGGMGPGSSSMYIFSLGFYTAHLEKVPEGLVPLANAHFTVELALRLIWLPRAVHHALHV
jgi:hypothetical protein